jgi:hypothetical protein
VGRREDEERGNGRERREGRRTGFENAEGEAKAWSAGSATAAARDGGGAAALAHVAGGESAVKGEGEIYGDGSNETEPCESVSANDEGGGIRRLEETELKGEGDGGCSVAAREQEFICPEPVAEADIGGETQPLAAASTRIQKQQSHENNSEETPADTLNFKGAADITKQQQEQQSQLSQHAPQHSQQQAAGAAVAAKSMARSSNFMIPTSVKRRLGKGQCVAAGGARGGEQRAGLGGGAAESNAREPQEPQQQEHAEPQMAMQCSEALHSLATSMPLEGHSSIEHLLLAPSDPNEISSYMLRRFFASIHEALGGGDAAEV